MWIHCKTNHSPALWITASKPWHSVTQSVENHISLSSLTAFWKVQHHVMFTPVSPHLPLQMPCWWGRNIWPRVAQELHISQRVLVQFHFQLGHPALGVPSHIYLFTSPPCFQLTSETCGWNRPNISVTARPTPEVAPDVVKEMLKLADRNLPVIATRNFLSVWFNAAPRHRPTALVHAVTIWLYLRNARAPNPLSVPNTVHPTTPTGIVTIVLHQSITCLQTRRYIVYTHTPNRMTRSNSSFHDVWNPNKTTIIVPEEGIQRRLLWFSLSVYISRLKRSV